MLFDNMDAKMVQAMIETMPLEVTVIDANDEVVGWNKQEDRIFKRPLSAMGLNFRDCHPQESLDKVEKIIEEMKAGKLDKISFWIDHHLTPGEAPHKILYRILRAPGLRRHLPGLPGMRPGHRSDTALDG